VRQSRILAQIQYDVKDYLAMAAAAKHDAEQAIEHKHSIPIQY
jgi:hypothetical protein